MKKEKIKSILIILLLIIIIALITMLIINHNKKYIPDLEHYSYIFSEQFYDNDNMTQKRLAIYDETNISIAQILFSEFSNEEAYLKYKSDYNYEEKDKYWRYSFDDENFKITEIFKAPYDETETINLILKSFELNNEIGIKTTFKVY